MIENDIKTCKTCLVTKHVSNFNRHKVIGYVHICKTCFGNKIKATNLQRQLDTEEFIKNHPDFEFNFTYVPNKF